MHCQIEPAKSLRNLTSELGLGVEQRVRARLLLRALDDEPVGSELPFDRGEPSACASDRLGLSLLDRCQGSSVSPRDLGECCREPGKDANCHGLTYRPESGKSAIGVKPNFAVLRGAVGRRTGAAPIL
jgi:hypothetical protein